MGYHREGGTHVGIQSMSKRPAGTKTSVSRHLKGGTGWSCFKSNVSLRYVCVRVELLENASR